MKLLDKLQIPGDDSEEFSEEFDEDFRSDLVDTGNTPTFPDDKHRDPAPGEPPTRRAKAQAARGGRGEVPRVTKKHRDDAQEEIQTFLEAIALAWGWQAPPCGDALEAAAPEVSAKFTKLLARNPRWLMKVRDGGILADAVGVAVALKPVVTTAWGFYSQPKGGDDANGVTFDPDRFPPYQP